MYSAGFYILKNPGKTPFFAAMVSLSRCISVFIPDRWAFMWDKSYNTELEDISALGLSESEMEEIKDEVNPKVGFSYHWPNTIFHYHDAARLFRTYGKTNGFTLIEAFIVEEDYAQVIQNLHDNGFVSKLCRKDRCQPGRFIGYEPINMDTGDICCSWFCNGIEAEFTTLLNDDLLFDDHRQARVVTEMINSGEIAAEEGFWVPVGLNEPYVL